MKKKLLAILMTMAMTFSLAACGSDSGETKEDSGGGKETSGDRELDDVVMSVQNQIAETNLTVLSPSNTLKIFECSDSILSPNIHVTSEKWDGGHTYITVTFYDYNTNQSVAVIKSSGIGMTVSHDQSIALSAIRKKISKLFK